MDYKFWILLLVCIVLFYMYNQVEDLKSEISHLHKKTENLGDLEKYVLESKNKETNKKFNNAINKIIPSKKEKSYKSKKYVDSETTSSIMTGSYISNNKSMEESYSNKNEKSNEDSKFGVNLEDVMDMIEQNHIDNIGNMNSEFKITAISEAKNENDLFIESTDEKLLDNSMIENKIDDNDNNDENEEIIMNDVKKNNEEELKNKQKYNMLMNKKVEDLRKLAEENNIDIEKVVDGKKKKKLKKELCEELSVH